MTVDMKDDMTVDVTDDMTLMELSASMTEPDNCLNLLPKQLLTTESCHIFSRNLNSRFCYFVQAPSPERSIRNQKKTWRVLTIVCFYFRPQLQL